MKKMQSLQTVVTVACASELANGIIQAVIGNDVADTIDSNVLNSQAVMGLTLSHFQTSLKLHRGGV